MTLKIKRLKDNAIIPIRAHEGDAGIDLTCIEITQELNEAGQVVLVYHTGLAVEIPEGYVGLLFSRSSISKKSITLMNCVGVIDSSYRGEVMGKFRSTTDVVPALYKPGERFAQLVIVPYLNVQIEESVELSKTDRGDGGYGSTGDRDISAAMTNQNSLESNNTTIDPDDNEQAAEQMSSEQV